MVRAGLVNEAAPYAGGTAVQAEWRVELGQLKHNNESFDPNSLIYREYSPQVTIHSEE